MKTVLLTGITGYLAKHIAVALLDSGLAVRGSMRSNRRVQEVNAAIANGVQDASSLMRLSFCELDLNKDQGWTDAVRGTDAVIHCASPFPFTPPRSNDDLIEPAVNGTLRALRATKATGVKRFILTSSAAAIAGSPLVDGQAVYDESHWTDIKGKAISAYTKSKVMAEKAAWEFVENEAPEIDLTAINPGLILGAPLDTKLSTSVLLLERILQGRDPMLPRLALGVVHVKDVAALHLKALSDKEATGQRVIAAESPLWMSEMAEFLREAYPNQPIRTRTAPDVLLRLLSLMDTSIKEILPMLGHPQNMDNSKARALLGRDLIPAKTAVLETADHLMNAKADENGLRKS